MLPESFDYSHAILRGNKGDYLFDKVISDGIQGKVLRFFRSRTPVIFKWYGGQTRNSPQNPDIPNKSWWACLNEIENLHLLDNICRIASFAKRMERKGLLYFPICLEAPISARPSVYLDGRFVQAHILVNQAVSSPRLEEMLDSPFAISPLIVDEIHTVRDTMSGKDYLPFSRDLPRQLKELGFLFDSVPVYQWIPGMRLDAFLAKPRPIEQRREVVRQLVHSAMILHGFGFLHRDLKPENVIITRNNKVKLVDFGIALRFAPADVVAVIAGDADYPVPLIDLENSCFASKFWLGSRVFSPCQIYGGRAGNKDDIYSVGLLSAIILTGEHPFLDGEERSYTNFYQLKQDAKEKVVKDYASRLRNLTKNQGSMNSAVEQYQSFLQRHASADLLQRIAPAFHPQSSMRMNRMIFLAWNLGMYFPNFPPLVDPSEYIGDFIPRMEGMLPSGGKGTVPANRILKRIHQSSAGQYLRIVNLYAQNETRYPIGVIMREKLMKHRQ